MSGSMKPLIIHPSAAKDASDIAAMYARYPMSCVTSFGGRLMMQSITLSSIPRDIITTQAGEEGAISNGFHTTFYLKNVLSAIESW